MIEDFLCIQFETKLGGCAIARERQLEFLEFGAVENFVCWESPHIYFLHQFLQPEHFFFICIGGIMRLRVIILLYPKYRYVYNILTKETIKNHFKGQ